MSLNDSFVYVFQINEKRLLLNDFVMQQNDLLVK